MKSKPNSDPSTRNPASTGQGSANPYSPSVPISVYRELAAELQATKTMLDSLNAQNQQLARQNQQLRQEIGKVVQSALSLQQFVVEPGKPANSSPRPTARVNEPMPNVNHMPTAADYGDRPTAAAAVDASTVAAQLRSSSDSSGLSDDLFTEQGEPQHQPESQSQGIKDMGGLWLTITVVVIVVTAFGAGFLVVRPLLPGNR